MRQFPCLCNGDHINELNYAKSDDNYVHIVTDKKEYVIPTTLKSFMEQFTNTNIIRVHRSYAVNKMKVVQRNSEVLIFADSNLEPIKIGRHFKKEVDRHFETLKTKNS